MPDRRAPGCALIAAGHLRGLTLDAPAKVNLDLRVVGRRDDNYHLLESTVALVELADRVALVGGAPGMRVEGATADVPLSSDNLAWRGLGAGLRDEPDDASLALEKRIPSAAGLGGGSSDAAAGWRLGRAWRGEPEDADGRDLATLAAIGADVPFFASRAPAARVTGVGEQVAPLDALALEVVLVFAGVALRTADVFAELREDEWGSATNDLLGPAQRLCPEIGRLRALVVAAGGEPRLSGSGPTLFVATDDADRADHVAGRLVRAGVTVTRTRTRASAASIDRHTEED